MSTDYTWKTALSERKLRGIELYSALMRKEFMLARVRVLGCALLVAIALVATAPAWSQSASSGADTILNATETAKLLPGPVFFRGQSAPVQGRNSGGIKFADGMWS